MSSLAAGLAHGDDASWSRLDRAPSMATARSWAAPSAAWARSARGRVTRCTTSVGMSASRSSAPRSPRVGVDTRSGARPRPLDGVAGLRRQDRGGQAGGAVLNVDPGCGEQVPDMTRVATRWSVSATDEPMTRNSLRRPAPRREGCRRSVRQVLVVCGTGGLGKSDRAQQGLIGVGGVDQCPCEAVVPIASRERITASRTRSSSNPRARRGSSETQAGQAGEDAFRT